MTDKMTNKKALTYALENCDLPEAVREKFEAMITALNKKSSAERKPTAKQIENASVKATLIEYIKENFVEGSEGFTVSDLLKECPVIKGKSNQYATAILNQAYHANEISKGTVKRRTYFAPNGVYAPFED